MADIFDFNSGAFKTSTDTVSNPVGLVVCSCGSSAMNLMVTEDMEPHSVECSNCRASLAIKWQPDKKSTDDPLLREDHEVE